MENQQTENIEAEKKYVKRFFLKLKIVFQYYFIRSNIIYIRVFNIFKLKFKKMQSYVEKSSIGIYKDLTPKGELETNKTYIDSLDWALSNDNILNIALTGPYGSGKSSIIKTYKEHRPFYNYLDISLATFHTNQDTQSLDEFVEDLTDDKKQEVEGLEENEIEKRILQQLFYKVKSKKIPFGRFRKINHVRTSYVIKGILNMLAVIVLCVFLFVPINNEDFGALSDRLLKKEEHIHWSLIIFSYTLLIFLSINIIISTVKGIIKTLKLGKISVKNAEFEFSKENENSIFNRYLDEILYFFEVNIYQIVLIEDLDRFNDVSIFMKLRELNSLINNSEEINRKVVFIYAIKDEMFINKDRTKFFDFILPVIPIINSSNSGEKMWEELVKHNLTVEKEITESFINDICLYIDDMRILNNVFNEYIVYKEKLMAGDESFLKPQRLFAMIVYKNIYPNDFAKLQFDSGVLYGLFQQKIVLIEEEISNLYIKIEELENELNQIDNEHIKLEKELRTIFWCEVIGYNSNILSINDGSGNNFSLLQVIQDSFDLALIKGQITGVMPNNRGISITLDKNTTDSFIARLDTVRKKSDEFINKTHEKIDDTKSKISYIKSWSLMKTIEEIGLDRFSLNRSAENNLIVFLTRNGYVDELYPYYINYFYPGSLKYFDMNFIMKIKDRIKLEYTHPLSNPQKVMSKLNMADISRKEILNFNLVKYLIDNEYEYKGQLNTLMDQLSDASEDSIRFVDSFLTYLNKEEEFSAEGKFILKICSKWHGIWNYIGASTTYSEAKKHEFLKLILINAEIEDIIKININNCFGDYMSNMSSFLELIPDEHNKTIKNIIEKLDIHFTNLILTNISNVNLWDFIIENDYYELNFSMVKLIVNYKSKMDDNDESLIKSHLTKIKSSNIKTLWTYITNNLGDYVEEVLFPLEQNLNESEDVVIFLLNKDEEELSLEIKKRIVSMQSVLISDINSIPNSLWEYTIDNLKLECTWSNILSVYEKDKLNNYLVDFLNLNEHYKLLSLYKIDTTDGFEEEIYKKFSKDLISCSELTSESFMLLKDSIPYAYNKFPSELLLTERLKDVIEYGLLNFTQENYDNIRENHKSNLFLFITHYIKNFLEKNSDYVVDIEDVQNLLLSNIAANYKIEIIQLFSELIVCNNALYANNICKAIFEHVQSIDISEKLLTSILSQNISIDNKIRILLNQKEYLNFENMGEYLEYIGTPYNQMIISRKQPVVSSTKLNQELLNMLLEHGIINSFREEKSGKIRVRAKY